MLIDLLPKHDWNITRAALAAGYSASYVDSDLIGRLKRNPRFSQVIQEKRQEIARQSWSIEQWRAEVTDLLHRCREANDRVTELGLLKQIAQHIGAYEADNRQRQNNIGMVIM